MIWAMEMTTDFGTRDDLESGPRQRPAFVVLRDGKRCLKPGKNPAGSRPLRLAEGAH
jgi:hypothetical protein